MANKIKYTVLLTYRVTDCVVVELDEGQNPNDALEIAEEISSNKDANDFAWDYPHCEIVDIK